MKINEFLDEKSACSSEVERVMRNLTRAVGEAVGKDLFSSIVEFLAVNLGVKYALISEIHCNNKEVEPVAITKSFFGDGMLQDNFEYGLEGTPCQKVIEERGPCFYMKGVADLFPEDDMLSVMGIESYIGVPLICADTEPCGLLVLLDTKPMENSSLVSSVVKIVAVRIAAELERRRNDQKMRTLDRAVNGGSASVIVTDAEGNIEYVNEAFVNYTAKSPGDVIGKNVSILKSGSYSPDFYRRMSRDILVNKEWHGKLESQSDGGDFMWGDVSIYPVYNDEKAITNYVAVSKDITEDVKSSDLLKLSGTIFENMTEAVFVTDKNNCITWVNPAFTKITGYSASEVIGKNPSILKSGVHGKEFYEEMRQSLEKTRRWEGEVSNRHKSGEIFHERLSIAHLSDSEGSNFHYVAMFSDITGRKRNEELIHRQANYDDLTGLPNKSLFLDRLGEAIKGAERGNASIAILLVNLDGFKWVNDKFGHAVGDDVLKLMSGRIRSAVRESDTVARLVSDEFTIMLSGLKSVHEVEPVIKKLMETLTTPIEMVGSDIFLTASIGVALYPDDSIGAGTLLKYAGSAMHQAKIGGCNTYRFFTQEMNHDAQERLTLKSELRRAIYAEEFEVYYQPMVDVATNEVKGAEALIRWNHPKRGMVSPAQFIPLAEESKLIIPIGLWMLKSVCQHIKGWKALGLELEHVSVNLSPCQCTDVKEARRLLDVVKESGVDPKQLVLEITESSLVEADDELIEVFKDYKDIGLRLSVDDFGTGYSSLVYLKRFPVDVLKIDQSFVAGLPDDHDDAVLVKAIIAMAKSLGLEVVGEGVETVAQLEALGSLGCDLAQGYLFSKPMPVCQVEGYLLGEKEAELAG